MFFFFLPIVDDMNITWQLNNYTLGINSLAYLLRQKKKKKKRKQFAYIDFLFPDKLENLFENNILWYSFSELAFN